MTEEEKQLVDISEQPIVFGVVSVFLFSVFCFCSLILFYQRQLSFYLFFLSICEEK